MNTVICHAERSEESTWIHAPFATGESLNGFFASLRMTIREETRA